MLSDEIVLPNSTIANIDERNHADLFFALKGAASSFGIVTKFTARTFATPARPTFFSYVWNLSPDDATRYLLAWQDYVIQQVPKEMGTGLTLGRGNENGTV